MATCVTWDEADLQWNQTNLTWNDVCIALEVAGGGGIAKVNDQDLWGFEDSDLWLQNYNKLDKAKKDRFIELVCMVKGEDGYAEEYSESKEKQDIEISVDDIKLTVKSILEVSLIEEI